MKKPPVIHPFLLAIFPVLFLFAHNADTMTASPTVVPATVLLGFTALTTVILNQILGEPRRAGLAVSMFLVLFFSYGHVFDALDRFVAGPLGFGLQHEHLLLAWAAIYALYVRVTVASEEAVTWTKILNVVAVCLVGVSLARVGAQKLRARGWPPRFGVVRVQRAETEPAAETRERRPDIYYIILDRYASSHTLQETFDFDNSAFTEHLEDRGFYVASDAYANYPKTFQSLASSLNMKHLTYLSDKLGTNVSDQTFVHAMLQDYEVWRFLKSQGYRYVHFGSWWAPTSSNRFADVNVTVPMAEFSRLIYRTTALYPLAIRTGAYDPGKVLQRGVLTKFEELSEAPSIKGPKFVFAHILLPHSPYMFGPDGEKLTADQVAARTPKENYLNQLVFTNTKIERLIEQIQSKSDHRPIIVLQADEGPIDCFEELAGPGEGDVEWSGLGDETLQGHMRILSAYYLPGVDYEEILYGSVTPVNSFRIIFNHYFGANYGLLEDRSYIFEDLKHPYSFIDVTDRVAYP